jgi:hypothetical protein
VAVATWLALAAPLPALGLARPVPALTAAVAAVAATALLVRAAPPARAVPAGPPPARRRLAAGPVPAAAVLVLAAGFGVLSALMHAEHVVLRRDAGSYALIGHWLATTGGLVVPDALAAVGGPAPSVTAASPAFFPAGDGGADLVPQFLVGVHLSSAAGWWIAGWTGLLVVPAVLGALALVAFGGLVGRLVGPGWAPAGVALLGLTYPVLHVARAPYSEPLAMLLLLGGLCLVLDALEPGGAPAAVALAAGAVVGLGTLVRVDVLREVALLVPVLGWLALRRSPAWRPLAAGLAAGCAWGSAAALVSSRPYLADIAGSLLPLAAGGLLLIAGTVAAVAVRRRYRLRIPYAKVAAPVGVALVLLALASRPLWLVARGSPATPAAGVVAGLQVEQGLPLDPGRTYAEHSVAWLSWYVGWPALLLAGVAAVVLARRAVEGRADRWVPPLAVVLGSAVLSLWRPAITPDHPWADRRFVPVVLPGVVLLVTWAVAAGVTLVRRRHASAARPATVAVAGVLAVAVPTAAATAPLLTTRTEQGQLAAVARACAALGPADVALLVDGRAAREWPQPLRGVCGVPAVVVPEPSPATVAAVAARARERGRRPVLVAAEGPALLLRLGAAEVEQVVDLATTEDARLLTRRPDAPVALDVDLWLGRLAATGGSTAAAEASG